MAIKQWLGAAPAIKQITTITVSGTVTTGDIFTVSIGFGSVSVVAGATPTPTTVAIALLAALTSNSVTGEFREIAWTQAAGVVTGTSAVAGVPFTVQLAETSSGATFAASTTQTATGPTWIDNPKNWSGGTLPTTGDAVVFGKSPNPVLYGFSEEDGFASIEFQLGFEQNFGLPEFNSLGYREYRNQYCPWLAAKVTVGTGVGRGSSMIKLDLGDSEADVLVFATGTRATEGEHPLQLIGAAADVVVENGRVSIAGRPLEVAAVENLTIGTNAEVVVGSGVTLGDVTTAGTSEIHSDCDNLFVTAGRCIYTAQPPQVDVSGGTLSYDSDKEITQAKIGPGTFDCSDLRERNCVTLRLRRGAQIIDPRKTLQINAIVLETGVQGLVVS